MLTEEEKYAGTGFRGLGDNQGYDQAVRYFFWIPAASIWLLSCVFALCNFWPHPRIDKVHGGLRIFEFAIQFGFGLGGSILLFVWHPTGEFSSQRTANLQALTFMTIFLFFVANGIVMWIYAFRATRTQVARAAIHASYAWIGYLLASTIGGLDTKNGNMQQFAGLLMILGSFVGWTSGGLLTPKTASQGRASPREWWSDVFREWLMYAMFSVSAVLMLCMKPSTPFAWLPQNARLTHPQFTQLVFFWVLLGVKVLAHLAYGCKTCAEGYMIPTSSSSKRSRVSKWCC